MQLVMDDFVEGIDAVVFLVATFSYSAMSIEFRVRIWVLLGEYKPNTNLEVVS